MTDNQSTLSFKPQKEVFHNLSAPVLVEHSLKNKEGALANTGALICASGKYTGRSPKDKFIVYDEHTKENVWWGKVNQKLLPENFAILKDKVFSFLQEKTLYQFDGYAGADPKYQLKVRIYSTKAWHALFVHNMFIRITDSEELKNFQPDYTIFNACEYSEADWQKLGLNSEVFIAFDIHQKIGLIGGTEYAGEMKKGIFSILNYLLPLQNVMAMHCSATVGEKGDAAVYFGLSGTGKTTLSADPERILIGDDEHGWSDQGVFNFEGGCYAKTINLSEESEHEIWDAIKFGAILENVDYSPTTRQVDFTSKKITENTRVSYPIDFMPRTTENGYAGHPKYVVMLTCDAFGVLPPVAKLSPGQASYHFLSGYTAKVAGTERGVTEPTATFSTCFGQPFMTLNPKVYADLLAKKMTQHGVQAYLLNTGWVGKGGKRIELRLTRKILHHILTGKVDQATFVKDAVFGFEVPTDLPEVPAAFLDPKNAWADGQTYAAEQKKLAQMFVDNFQKLFASTAPDLLAYGPKV